MIGTKTEEMGSRKKLLAPVVVLLLCAVSLTGAAYAYSSTMTNTGNSIDAGMLSIDLKLNGAGTDVANDAIVFGEENIVTFTDNYGYTAGVFSSKTNQVGYEIPTAAVTIVTYKVNIVRETGNSATVNLTVGSSNLMNTTLFTVSGTSKTVADLYDVKIQVDSGAATDITQVGETTEYNTTVNNLSLGEHIVILTFVKKDAVAATGYTTAESFSMSAGTPTLKTAKAWSDDISGKTFTLSFMAEPYVAP